MAEFKTEEFNRIEQLTKVDDPRMEKDKLHKDEVFNRSRLGIDKIPFLRNGIESKFELVYADERWIMRPLSWFEEQECENLAADDYNKLPEHHRTQIYKLMRYKLHVLSKCLSATPWSKDIKVELAKLEACPSYHLLNLYEEYAGIMADLNPNIDRMKQKDLDNLIAEIEEEPSNLGKLSRTPLCLIIMRLLAANMLLRGKSHSESQSTSVDIERTSETLPEKLPEESE